MMDLLFWKINKQKQIILIYSDAIVHIWLIHSPLLGIQLWFIKHYIYGKLCSVLRTPKMSITSVYIWISLVKNAYSQLWLFTVYVILYTF